MLRAHAVVEFDSGLRRLVLFRSNQSPGCRSAQGNPESGSRHCQEPEGRQPCQDGSAQVSMLSRATANLGSERSLQIPNIALQSACTHNTTDRPPRAARSTAGGGGQQMRRHALPRPGTGCSRPELGACNVPRGTSLGGVAEPLDAPREDTGSGGMDEGPVRQGVTHFPFPVD
jgi:hypothetical protein